MARMPVSVMDGLPFPCGRDGIIAFARSRSASPFVLIRLRGLPERRFNDLADVLTALGRPQDRALARRSMAGGQGSSRHGFSAAPTVAFQCFWLGWVQHSIRLHCQICSLWVGQHRSA